MPKKLLFPQGPQFIVVPASQQDAVQALFVSLPEVLNSKDAAKALDVPDCTLRELARNGEIRGFKVGSVWRFTRKSLVEYVQRQEAVSMKGMKNEKRY